MQKLIKIPNPQGGATTIPAIVRGPLALHKTLELTKDGFLGAIGDGWMVSHAESGIAAGYYSWSPAIARWKLRELLKLDWSAFGWEYAEDGVRCTGIPEGAREINRLANERDEEK